MSSGNITTQLLTKTVTIDTDLSNKEYYLVDWDATDANVVNLVEDALSMPMLLIGAGDGSSTAIRGTVALGGISKVKIAGTVAAGDSLVATTGGAAIASTTDGNRAIGYALEGGSSGDIIEVLVAPHFVYVA